MRIDNSTLTGNRNGIYLQTPGGNGVTNAGTIHFKKRLLFIANALKQHPIGLEEVADGIWSIHFCQVLLGRVDERDYIIRA